MGIFVVMFLILFTLKLGVADTEVQEWSWLLVTAPLWGSALVMILFLLAGGTAAAALRAIGLRQSRKRVSKMRASRNLPPQSRRRSAPLRATRTADRKWYR